ncbi:MAG TPA: hypothetical protein VNQ77_04565 [Frankiaceae bacterium]|nr:hypothetical protein [Frankiaceae bacterium]
MRSVGEFLLAAVGFILTLAGAAIGLRAGWVYAADRGWPRGDSRRAVVMFGGLILWPAIAAYVIVRLVIRRVRHGRWV